MYRYSSLQESYYLLAGVWLEPRVVQAFFLLWQALLLELGGNYRLGSKSSGGCVGMSFEHFGVFSSTLGRW